jgi:hypothetical protein
MRQRALALADVDALLLGEVAEVFGGASFMVFNMLLCIYS